MIAELGHYALVLALALALDPGDRAALGRAHATIATLMGVAGSTALAQFAFVALSFAALTACYVASDFSVAQRVREFAFGDAADLQVHRRVGEPRRLDAAVGADPRAVRRAGRAVRRQSAGDAEGQCARACRPGSPRRSISSSSSPRTRSCASPQAPLEGRDLNPILQDLGLAMHPPLLYLGYVGFSISFSFAIAALIEGRIDAAWARWVRPWTLAAWMFLTLGIAMGSYWAYYELGWGGWWFWDPVENASLMPWLAGTALLHSAVVMEKRNALKVWTILLAILDLLAVAARHLPGALRRAHLGAYLRHRSDARRVHPRDPGVLHRRRACALRLARAGAEAGRAVRADLARRRAGVQQPVPHHGLRDRVRRHALSARARSADRREDFGRRAVLQSHLRPAVRAAAARGAVRAAAGLEARRSPRRRAAADRRRRRSALVAIAAIFAMQRRRAGAGAVRHRACGLRHGRRADRSRRAHRRCCACRSRRRCARARGLPRSAWGTALAHFGARPDCCSASSARASWGTERIVVAEARRDASRCAATISPSTADCRGQGRTTASWSRSFTVRQRRRRRSA